MEPFLKIEFDEWEPSYQYFQISGNTVVMGHNFWNQTPLYICNLKFKPTKVETDSFRKEYYT